MKCLNYVCNNELLLCSVGWCLTGYPRRISWSNAPLSLAKFLMNLSNLFLRAFGAVFSFGSIGKKANA